MEMAREPVLAAGGIVLRREQPPLVAVVRLRKRDEWVLPKGKLNDGETPRAAARREVLEETGHNVTVHEFLGTLVYESGGRSKVVHYWRMEAGSEQVHELMSDVRAVDWLPLDAAVARLSRGYERAFLANVGPLAVTVLTRKLKAKAAAPAPSKVAPAAKKRRSRPTVAPELPLAVSQPPLVVPPVTLEESPTHVSDVVAEEMPMLPVEPAIPEPVVTEPEVAPAAVTVEEAGLEETGLDETAADQTAGPLDASEDAAADQAEGERRSLAQKVRDWLGRAA
jgi:8-oxo-dGTP diphosphatase